MRTGNLYKWELSPRHKKWNKKTDMLSKYRLLQLLLDSWQVSKIVYELVNAKRLSLGPLSWQVSWFPACFRISTRSCQFVSLLSAAVYRSRAATCIGSGILTVRWTGYACWLPFLVGVLSFQANVDIADWGSEVFTAMKIQVVVLWVVTAEDRGNENLRNIGILSHIYMVSQPRRLRLRNGDSSLK
jgi:hypothetical protein